MAKVSASPDAAGRLQSLVQGQGNYAHLTVRAQGAHLVVEVASAGGEKDVVARATALGGGQYGLGFLSHTGKWEPLPVQGPLESIAEGLTGLLGPHLDLDNLR